MEKHPFEEGIFLPQESLADLDRKILLVTALNSNTWQSVSTYMNLLEIPHTEYNFLKEILTGLSREKWLRMTPDPQPPLPPPESPKFTIGSRLMYALRKEYFPGGDDEDS